MPWPIMRWEQHQDLESGRRFLLYRQFLVTDDNELITIIHFKCEPWQQSSMTDNTESQEMVDSDAESFMIEDPYDNSFSGCEGGQHVGFPNADYVTAPSGTQEPVHSNLLQHADNNYVGGNSMAWDRILASNDISTPYAGNVEYSTTQWSSLGHPTQLSMRRFDEPFDGLPAPVLGEPHLYSSTSSVPTRHSFASYGSSNTISSTSYDSMDIDGMPPTTNFSPTASHSGQTSFGGNTGVIYATQDVSTVSPKLLKIMPSPTHSSSSSSKPPSLLPYRDCNSGVSSPEPQRSLARQHHHKSRRPLPAKSPPKPRTSTHHHRPRPFPQEPRPKPKPQGDSTAAGRHLQGAPRGEVALPPPPPPIVPLSVAERTARDEFLIRNKMEGKTYKEIRRMGNFTEAESTLRGRFRALTKNKEARVRKPEWTDKDIKLLKKGVRELATGEDLKTAKVPWKKVAEYIISNGGSYHFGNATCRKKWDELVELGRIKSK